MISLQLDTNFKSIKDEICDRFSELVKGKQLIVREDLFLDALNMHTPPPSPPPTPPPRRARIASGMKFKIQHPPPLNTKRTLRLLREVIIEHGESYPEFGKRFLNSI